MAFSSVCCSHIGFVSNTSVTVPFRWNVLSTISVSQVFSWDVGEGPLYWYLIESNPFSSIICSQICPHYACVSLEEPTSGSSAPPVMSLRSPAFNGVPVNLGPINAGATPNVTSFASQRIAFKTPALFGDSAPAGSCDQIGLNGCPLPLKSSNDNKCVYFGLFNGLDYTLTIDNLTGTWTLDISDGTSSLATYVVDDGSATVGASAILTLSRGSCGGLAKEATVELQNDSGYVQLDTVAATSVNHLCERLREMGYGRTIARIRRWTKPALECDVKRAAERGITYCCNDLVPVDLCECECMGFVPPTKELLSTCSMISVSSEVLTWYTEYLHLENVQVSAGDEVVRGQILGYITKPPGAIAYLHWGVGDGQGGGPVGQTIDVDDVFNWPASSIRPAVSPPNSTTLTDDEVCYISSTLTSPVTRDCCLWFQDFESALHSDYEYYAQDLSCTQPDQGGGMAVYVASGGCDITSTVTTAEDVGSGWLVVVRHVKRAQAQTKGETILPFQMTSPFRSLCSLGWDAPAVVGQFGASPIRPLQPVAKPVAVQGYLKPVPATLKLTHNLPGPMSKVPKQVVLNYNAVTGSWQYSRHFLADGVQWSILFTLANAGDDWTLQAGVGRSAGGKNRITKLKAGVKGVPASGFVIEVNFDPASGVMSSNCTLGPKSIIDELKLLNEPLTMKVGEK